MILIVVDKQISESKKDGRQIFNLIFGNGQAVAVSQEKFDNLSIGDTVSLLSRTINFVNDKNEKKSFAVYSVVKIKIES